MAEEARIILLLPKIYSVKHVFLRVFSAVSGVQVKIKGLHENYVVIISCVILMVLFSIQHHGTHRVAFMFAPLLATWLLCISGIGVYNRFYWNRHIYRALSPLYMLKFLRATGIEGWMPLGGVVLSITGTYHIVFVAFTCLVYPFLILAYMGQAAFLSKHHHDIQESFYKAIPETVFWPVFVVATLAAIVRSQAVISATFSIVSQCCALNCFPPVKIVHTSSRIHGQIYAPEVNWILMCLCLAVTIGLRDIDMMGHACGLATTTIMFVTTCLMTLVMLVVTITHQSHLCPLPLTVQPITWNYDHCLYLYPTPHTVLLLFEFFVAKIFKSCSYATVTRSITKNPNSNLEKLQILIASKGKSLSQTVVNALMQKRNALVKVVHCFFY
ncbi:hypothetical protein JHK82_027836 [Glycine max]|nr:hypothetical protein JHK82_027836 [Glycine max]